MSKQYHVIFEMDGLRYFLSKQCQLTLNKEHAGVYYSPARARAAGKQWELLTNGQGGYWAAEFNIYRYLMVKFHGIDPPERREDESDNAN